MDEKNLEKIKVALFNLEHSLMDYFEYYYEADKISALKQIQVINKVIIDNYNDFHRKDVYKKFIRTSISEMTPWYEEMDMNGISISEEDKKNGSPKVGDMISRNENNHSDKWLVAEEYFLKYFEPTL